MNISQRADGAYTAVVITVDSPDDRWSLLYAVGHLTEIAKREIMVKAVVRQPKKIAIRKVSQPTEVPIQRL